MDDDNNCPGEFQVCMSANCYDLCLDKTCCTDDMPENDHTSQSWYFSGVCYIRLGEYEKTIAHFEKVIEELPDYEYAWSAQHLIGTYVNLLMEAGKMPATEAEPKIEAAWQAMIDNYPQKPLYDVALHKLGGFYLERGQPQKAVWYFETFCEEYPEDMWRAKVLYDLAGAYEDTGEPALAVDVYEEFIEDYPDDPAVVANTVIDGVGLASAVTFEGSEGSSYTLTGYRSPRWDFRLRVKLRRNGSP